MHCCVFWRRPISRFQAGPAATGSRVHWQQQGTKHYRSSGMRTTWISQDENGYHGISRDIPDTHPHPWISQDIPGYPRIYGNNDTYLRVISQYLDMHAYIFHTPYIICCSQNWRKLCANHSLCQCGMYQYIPVCSGISWYT